MTDICSFRGKRTDNGEWAYGDLLRHLQSHANPGIEYDDEEFPVNPSTVGQCTGLRDQSGHLVFAGDIIIDGMERKSVVKWKDNTASFISEFLNQTGIHKISTFSSNVMRGEHLKVLGNIHDNPELLEVKS